MDVISTIKVRNADGSLSDSLPIGTVSDYITIAADGSSLSSILGNVDLNRYGSIQSQINALGGGSGIADGVVYVGDDPVPQYKEPLSCADEYAKVPLTGNGTQYVKVYFDGLLNQEETQYVPSG